MYFGKEAEDTLEGLRTPHLSMFSPPRTYPPALQALLLTLKSAEAVRINPPVG